MSKLICIEDFNGYLHPGHFPVAFWADYDLQSKLIYFGGDWQELKPYKWDKDSIPSAEDVHNIVTKLLGSSF